MNPLVSILIPTFNRESLIAETVASALAQEYDPLEVIVVDNASTDGTWKVLQELASEHANLRCFRNESNIGPVANWIECTKKARGVYAKILWSDDLLDPGFLKKTTPYLASEQTGFVYTAARIFKDKATPTQGQIYYENLATGIHSTRRFIEGSLLCEPFPVSPGCALFRTEDLRRNLWLDIPNAVSSNFRAHAIGNDLLIFLLTASQYPTFAVVQEPLSFFRDHSGSISTHAQPGKLTLHYDLVRAYFSQEYIKDEHLRRKLNTLLWWHRHRYNGSLYGIHSMKDFFTRKTTTSLSIAYLIQRLIRRHTALSR